MNLVELMTKHPNGKYRKDSWTKGNKMTDLQVGTMYTIACAVFTAISLYLGSYILAGITGVCTLVCGLAWYGYKKRSNS